MNSSLDSQIEAILFFKGEPVTKTVLSKLTNTSVDEVNEAVRTLSEKLSNRGIVLVEASEGLMLGTAPSISPLIEAIAKEELSRDLGKAGLETLAIVAYKGSASKREIDYIRGVNSGFILRNLLIRGLVKREESKGERGFIYSPTIELLSYMGVTKPEDMPEFEVMKKELEDFFVRTDEESTEQTQNE